MSHPSYLPRNYKIFVHLLSDDELEAHYRRHCSEVASPASEACLEVLLDEKDRRASGYRRPTYEELRQRRVLRRKS